MVFRFSWVPKLADGLLLTLEVTSTCIAIGLVLGVLLALARVYGNRPLRALCGVYIQVFRGTPLLVQLSIVYFGLPTWGITLSGFTSAVLALGLNTAAYQAEYFRGAIQAVTGGQLLAARSVGMSLSQALRYVILPQAFRIVIPSWSNELILMIKYSSIIFSITLYDLMGVGKRIAARESRYFEVFIVVALFYMAIVLIVSQLLKILERRLRLPGMGADAEMR